MEILRKYLYRIISIGNILYHKFFELDVCLPLLMMINDIFINIKQWAEVERETMYGLIVKCQSKYTAFWMFYLLFLYGIYEYISMIASHNTLCGEFILLLFCICWLPLSTFWRRYTICNILLCCNKMHFIFK